MDKHINAAVSPVSVAIVILSWNGAKVVGPCIKSIICQLDIGDELILVCNGSTDGSERELLRVQQQNPTSVRLVQNATNIGFSAGMNVGFRCARAGLVVLANDDIVFAPDFVSALKNAASRYVGVAMFSPAIYEYGTGFSREKIGQSGVSGFGLFYRARFIPTGGVPRRSVLAYGCCIIGRVSDFQAICIGDQLFEEAFHTGYEDLDLCFRLYNKKKQLLHVPQLRVEHVGSASSGEGTERIFNKPGLFQRQLYRNRWLWVLLNEKLANLVLRAPFFLGVELLVLGYLVVFHRRCVPHYIKGVADSFGALKRISRRRRSAVADAT